MTAAAADDFDQMFCVVALIIDLETWTERPTAVLARLWSCPTCCAGLHEPCRRPDGSELDSDSARVRRLRAQHPSMLAPTRPRCHAPRLARSIRAFNQVMPRAWKQDLAAGIVPERVLAEVQRTVLYRRLSELGLLAPPPRRWMRLIDGGSP